VSEPYPPENVRRLLRHIETYENLGALILVNAEPGRDWTVDEVGERLKVTSSAASEVLNDLTRLTLLVAVAEGKFRCASTPREGVATVEQLIGIYRDDPVVVIRELTQNALDRVRTHALRTFSDAFVLGRKSG
jgi:hypothetical protein